MLLGLNSCYTSHRFHSLKHICNWNNVEGAVNLGVHDYVVVSWCHALSDISIPIIYSILKQSLGVDIQIARGKIQGSIHGFHSIFSLWQLKGLNHHAACWLHHMIFFPSSCCGKRSVNCKPYPAMISGLLCLKKSLVPMQGLVRRPHIKMG